MCATQQNFPGQEGKILMGVQSSPWWTPDPAWPGNGNPVPGLFLCIAMLSRCNVVHALDDLVTLASGGFETIPVENDDLAAVVTDQLA
jgi:hypothetical protein